MVPQHASDLSLTSWFCHINQDYFCSCMSKILYLNLNKYKTANLVGRLTVNRNRYIIKNYNNRYIFHNA